MAFKLGSKVPYYGITWLKDYRSNGFKGVPKENLI